MNVSGQSNSLPVKVPPCHLSDDLGRLLENTPFHDVTLALSSKEFKAHKIILAGKCQLPLGGFTLVNSKSQVHLTQPRPSEPKTQPDGKLELSYHDFKSVSEHNSG